MTILSQQIMRCGDNNSRKGNCQPDKTRESMGKESRRHANCLVLIVRGGKLDFLSGHDDSGLLVDEIKLWTNWIS
jgi:hypothetical protein